MGAYSRGRVTAVGADPSFFSAKRIDIEGNVGWRFAICYGVFAALLVAAHAGQKAGLVEPPVEEATHQQELEASVAEFEESLSKDSRVSIKKDDGEA